ncbi:AAA family ATPase [Altibacter sp.]|uniref:ATP-dependent nuclease n=1 Tax=Altibacter sp. TaxID=2024823 RepID=UPI0025BDFC91|nr:AAA family ATPase [Altibacter sp.]
MELKKITIKNYKSIDYLEIPLNRVNGSLTFSLLGVNESGKSSILKAISFISKSDAKFPEDYFNTDESIKIAFHYTLEAHEKKEILEKIDEDFKPPKKFLSQVVLEELELIKNIANTAQATVTKEQFFSFKKHTLNGFKIENQTIVVDKESKIYLEDLFEEKYKNHFWTSMHKIVFWKSEDKFLISRNINLANFASNPNTSIPLKNCFHLVGIDTAKIQSEINKLNDPASISNLVERLNDKVTEHIKRVWANHPIKLKFNINNNILVLLVEDEGVKYAVKTTNQRSDGFRQFVSFLLTISIENLNEELNNTILLLDEPETHLHPTAQLNLKDELLNISKSTVNNVVFYATHSNYLIDKSNLNRSFKIEKENNLKTVIQKISKIKTSYSEINFEIFDIPTNDYHNELYGFIKDNSPTKLNEIPKDRTWIKHPSKKEFKVSLCEYIRHSIHHPENTLNRKFTDAQLRKSINIMRKIKDNI